MHGPRTKSRRGCRDPGAPLSTDRGGYGQGWGQSCKLPGPAPRCPRTPQNRLDRSRTVLSGDIAHPRLQGDEKVPGQPTTKAKSSGHERKPRRWGPNSGAGLTPAPPRSPFQPSARLHPHTMDVFSTLSPSYVHGWPSSVDWKAYLSENACCLMRENLCTFETEKSLRTFWVEWEEYNRW